MKEELQKELEKRGTAEISNGQVVQVTQALSETDKEVDFLMFGERRKQKIIPIDEACAKCTRNYRFKTKKDCQGFQAKDGKARGFNTMICPQQLAKS